MQLRGAGARNDGRLSAISTLNGCIDTVMHPVVVLPAGRLALHAPPWMGCTPLFVEFTDTSTDTDFARGPSVMATAAGKRCVSYHDSSATYPVQMMAMNLNGLPGFRTSRRGGASVPTMAFTYSITELPDIRAAGGVPTT